MNATLMLRTLHNRGECNPNAVLTDDEAIELILRIHNGESARAVGESYGITASAARMIYRGISRPAARAAVIAKLMK